MSVAIAAAGGLLAYKTGLIYVGLLAVLFAAQNLATLRQPAGAEAESEERPAG